MLNGDKNNIKENFSNENNMHDFIFIDETQKQIKYFNKNENTYSNFATNIDVENIGLTGWVNNIKKQKTLNCSNVDDESIGIGNYGFLKSQIYKNCSHNMRCRSSA